MSQSEHDPETCPRCKQRELYVRIEDMLIGFLENTFDEKAFPENQENYMLLVKVLLHRSAHLAIEAGEDLPSFVAEASREMIIAQKCVMAARLEEVLERGMAMAQRGDKSPEDLN
jgi:hypothetical protein